MHALIVCAVTGPGTVELVAAIAPDFDLRVGADRGARTLLDAGILPDLVVGDADSLSATDLAALDQERVPLELHPRDKDATDLDLALAAVRARGATHVTVVGATGGRLDHTLATVGSLAVSLDLSPVLVDPGLTGWFLDAENRPRLEIEGVGTPVSVQAITDTARVSSVGLRWCLDGLELLRFGSRGVSNRIESSPASLVVGEGVVLVSCENDLAAHTRA